MKTLNEKLLSINNQQKVKDAIKLDAILRKRKTVIIKAKKITVEARTAIDKGYQYMKTEKTLCAQGKRGIQCYLNSVKYFERALNKVHEEFHSRISFTDIEKAEQLLELQTVDGIKASIKRLQIIVSGKD